MLEIGREPVHGEADDKLLEEAARLLMGEAGTGPPSLVHKAEAGRG
jgi:hypothetical protein